MKNMKLILSQCLYFILGSPNSFQASYHRLNPMGGVAFVVIEH